MLVYYMKKIVFISPWLLFLIYLFFSFLHAFAAILLGNGPSNEFVLLIGYGLLIIVLVLMMYWPLQVYKYLCSQTPDMLERHPSKFDLHVIGTILVLFSFIVLSEIALSGTEFIEDQAPLLETVELLAVLYYFIILFRIFWSNSKMMNGGLGWCIAFFYWPITSYFIQIRIRELYPEIN